MKVMIFCLSCLLTSSICAGQKPKHRGPDRNATFNATDRCVDVHVFPVDGAIQYEYLTGQKAGGDLRWELGELAVQRGHNCRLNVFFDESLPISEMKHVPIAAIYSGLTNIHVYIHWSRTSDYVASRKNRMAEVGLNPIEIESSEVAYGKVEFFPKLRKAEVLARAAKLDENELGQRPGCPTDNATVDLTATPDGAQIRIDDSDRGDTPSVLTLPPGDHWLRVEKKGFKSWEKRFTVSAGGFYTVNATLLPE